MKTLFVLLLTLVCFSGLIFPQETRTSRTYTIANNDSIVDIDVPDSYYLVGIKFDSTVTASTDTMFFYVSEDGTNYGPLIKSGVTYFEKFSGTQSGVSLSGDALNAWQRVRVVLNKKQTGIKGLTARFNQKI